MVYDLNELKGRIYSIPEVARILGVGQDAIRRRVRLGQLPVRRPPGSEMLVYGDDLAAYLLGDTPAPRPPRTAKPSPRVEGRVEAVSSNVGHPGKPQEAPEAAAPTGAQAVVPFKLAPEARDRLKIWMEAAGITPAKLAAATGINASSLSYIIGTGRRATRAICRDNALRLRAVYGDELLRYLMDGGEVPGRG